MRLGSTKMALKMPFGQEYWNERNTSRYKLLMGVCDCLSGGEAERRAEAILPHPGWIAKQELAATELAAVLRCVRSSDASLLEHMQNLSKISLHYDPPRKNEVAPAACKVACYSCIHQVNQPFIMYAAFWRAGNTFIFRALCCANEKVGTGQLRKWQLGLMSLLFH